MCPRSTSWNAPAARSPGVQPMPRAACTGAAPWSCAGEGTTAATASSRPGAWPATACASTCSRSSPPRAGWLRGGEPSAAVRTGPRASGVDGRARRTRARAGRRGGRRDLRHRLPRGRRGCVAGRHRGARRLGRAHRVGRHPLWGRRGDGSGGRGRGPGGPHGDVRRGQDRAACCCRGAEHAGTIRVVDIGFADDLVPHRVGLIEPADVVSMLPSREADGHKRRSGVLLVVAGSRRMTGAPALIARAAARIGAGLVTVAAPDDVLRAVQAHVTEAVFLPLPRTSEGARVGSRARPGCSRPPAPPMPSRSARVSAAMRTPRPSCATWWRARRCPSCSMPTG